MVQAIRRHPTAFASIGILAILAVVAPLVLRSGTIGIQGPPPTSVELSSALMRAGLDAESLTAAGASGQDIADVVDAVSDHLAASPGVIAAADSDYAAARTSEAELSRLVRSGLGSAADVSAYQSAKSDLESAEAARAAALDAVFDAGVAALSQAKANALASMRANADWRLPKQYLCVDRTQQEWVDLREALANLRIAADYGEDADAECSSLVATADANSGVASAKVALDSSLAANETAWKSAVGL